MDQAPSFQEFAEKYFKVFKVVDSGNEPNLIAVFINRNKTKAVRQKIGRFIKRGYTNKGRVCPCYISKVPYFGFFKV